MSVRGLVIGDNHFTTSNLVETEQFLDKIEIAVRRLQPDFIVCLGDLLDRHEICHLDPFLNAHRFIELLAGFTKVYVLIGNHDRRNNSDFQSPDHFFTGLRYHPNVVIVDRALKAGITGKNGEGNFLFVPYVPTGRFQEALETIDLTELEDQGKWRSSSIDAIFAHQEFRGVKMGVKQSEHGDYWCAEYPLVISGHIHEYQVLSSNVIYVGTPSQHTFAESTNKAVALFHFNMESYASSLPLKEALTLEELGKDPQVRASYLRVQLGLKVKRTVQLTVEQLLSEGLTLSKNEVLRLIITGEPSQLKALAKNKTLDQLRSQGIKVSLNPINDLPLSEEKGLEDLSLEDFSSKKRLSFLEELQGLIAPDPDLSELFQVLFIEK